MRTVDIDRKKQFTEIGAKILKAQKGGTVTRRAVAKKAGVSEALVGYWLGSGEEANKGYLKYAKKHLGYVPEKAVQPKTAKKPVAKVAKKPEPKVAPVAKAKKAPVRAPRKNKAIAPANNAAALPPLPMP